MLLFLGTRVVFAYVYAGSCRDSPEDTPWEGGTFKLRIAFTEEYPNKAPTVKILSPMFHPNGTLSSVCELALSRFSIRGRRNLLRYFTKPVESYL